MKTLHIATAIIATAFSSASMAWNDTNSVTWGGNRQTVAGAGCSFRNHAGGAIQRGSGLVETTDWITTRAATIQVRTRGNSTISMASDNVLRLASDGSDTGVLATVDYTGAAGGLQSGIVNAAGGTDRITAAAMTVSNTTSNTAALITFTAGGSATLSVAGLTGEASKQAALDGLANDTDYIVNHTVTCSQ